MKRKRKKLISYGGLSYHLTNMKKTVVLFIHVLTDDTFEIILLQLINKLFECICLKCEYDFGRPCATPWFPGCIGRSFYANEAVNDGVQIY